MLRKNKLFSDATVMEKDSNQESNDSDKTELLDTAQDASDTDQDSSIKRRVTVSRYDPYTGTYSKTYYPDPILYPILYPTIVYG
ncbi:unnamed protein product [Diamesa hyperborea]